MDRMAQRMVSIKKDMMHDDDDDVDRIYWALARGPGQMLFTVPRSPIHFICHAISSNGLFPFAPCLVSVDPCRSR
jgi:hypothetical protein